MPAPMILRVLPDARDPRWDAYVESHPDGTFHHLLGWRRVIERAYPHEPHYLYVEQGGAFKGVLPLFSVFGRPFARALVSAPVGVSGGVLADDEESARLLKDGARAIAERDRLDYVEYKSEKAIFSDLRSNSELYVTFRQPLFEDRERQLNAIPRKTRAVIRHAEKAHLRADLNRTDVEPFYDLYALSLRNLGTPMFPKELFLASLEELPDRCDILTIRETGRIIGAVMNYYYKDVILPFYAGTLPEARDVGVNNYVYWVLLETGYARGYRGFDFGRSKIGTGSYEFKRHFGMQEIPLHYQYDLIKRAKLPDLNPKSPRYAKAVELWQKLPVELTKVIGPLISRRIP